MYLLLESNLHFCMSGNLNRFPCCARSAQGGAPPSSEGASRRTITMYRNGFVVDDGPFRPLEDPENVRFLRDINSG